MKNVIHTEEREKSIERINAFSDGIFAIIITIMVLELKKPEEASFAALGHLWPSWASPGLIWANFGHLFAVSLVPFLTGWMAETRLAAVPVALYAFIFFIVNLTYLGLIRETVAHHPDAAERSGHRLFHIRSLTTLLLALLAMGLAFWHPVVGFAVIGACFFVYLRPEAPKV